ncbi:MAG: hypothetical protein V4456_03390 [Bacteroidota bacterium]
MKRTYPLNNSVVIKRCIILVLALSGIIYSCKKELSVSQAPPLTQKQQADVVNEAKTWFQKNEAINKPSVAVNTAGGTRSWYDGLNPGWDNTLVYEKDKGTVIEMPLLNSAVAFLMNTTDGSKASLQTNYTKTTYLIQKDSAGVFKGWFMVLIADTAYVNGDFSKLNKNTYQQRDPAYSGRLMYFDINGKFAGGWRYQNGAITKTLTLTNATTTGGGPQINSEKPKAVNTVGCITKTVTTVTWACVDTAPVSPPKWNASVRTNAECVAYVTVKSVEECTYGGGGGGGNNIPGTGGNTNFPSPIEQGCKSLAPASVDGKQVNLQPPVPTTPDDPCLVKPPVPEPVVVDTVKIVKQFCDNLTEAQKGIIVNTVMEFKNYNCLTTYLYNTIASGTSGYSFCISPGTGNATYNPGTKSINFTTDFAATFSNILGHELFHGYQDMYYPGGTTAYGRNAATGVASPGFSNIEFEQAVFNDILYKGENTAFHQGTQAQQDAYRNWINTITNGSTSYPKLTVGTTAYNNFITQYNSFLTQFSTIPGGTYSGTTINLNPSALINLLNKSNCN